MLLENKSKHCLIILILTLSQLFSENKLQKTTLQMIGLFRSGAAYPETGEILKYLKNSDYSKNSQLHGQISGNGLRASYILGYDLSNRYPVIANNSKNLKDFEVIVSKMDRTLMTAQSVMLGIFKINNDKRSMEKFDKDLLQPPFAGQKTLDETFTTPLPNGVYPVPFQSFNKEFNNVLRPWDNFGCKQFMTLNSKMIEKESKTIDEFNLLLKKAKDLDISSILGGSKKSVADSQQIISVMEYLNALKGIGVDFSLSKEDYKSMQNINDLNESLMYLNEDALKIIMYRFNKSVNKNIDALKTSLKDKTNYSKYVLYAGHFQTLWALLASMKMTSTDCLKNKLTNKDIENCEGKPVYNSSIMLEIYKKSPDATDLYVTMYYNNTDMTSKLEDCLTDGECKLQKFLDLYMNPNLFESDDDLDVKCLNYDVSLKAKLIALAVACCFFSVVMILIFIKVLKAKLKSD